MARKLQGRKAGKIAGKNYGNVLVVEDDAVLALTIEQTLLDAGASQVETCASTAKAMEKLESFSPQIAVLDVHLADSDNGWAIAELVTQIVHRKPRIIFSTGTPEDVPEHIAQLGTVLAKPYSGEELIAAIDGADAKPGLIARLRNSVA